jgi:hypothetical protein
VRPEPSGGAGRVRRAGEPRSLKRSGGHSPQNASAKRPGKEKGAPGAPFSRTTVRRVYAAAPLVSGAGDGVVVEV